LDARVRNALLVGCAVVVATTVARAQPADPIGDLLATTTESTSGPSMATARQTVANPLSAGDRLLFLQALGAAKRGDVSGARSAISGLSDAVARKTATWALVDANAESLSFYEVDAARRDLAGFPRAARRQVAAERLLETSGKAPGQVVDWFAGQPPQSAQGAMALASAYRTLGRQAEAADLIRSWWRTKSFEADVQRAMLTRFSDVLTIDDHVRRADILLYGSQGPAARDMVALLPADQQPAALARITMRTDARAADDAWAGLTPEAQATPGAAFERAAYLRRKGQDTLAMALLSAFPKEMVTAEGADRMWDERHRLALSAIRGGDWRSAYQAAANSGLSQGADATEAEFYAGWIALKRLNDPVAAGRHFAAIERIGSSPITRARAFYWEGRAAEARGDKAAADDFYGRGAEHVTTFYGQLAAEKLGHPLVLPRDPVATDAERAGFERQDAVQAMRLLADQGQRDLFRAFALHLDDTVPTVVDAALLVDAIRSYGDQDTSMKAARAAAQRGLILADRAYPVRTPPGVQGAPEPALVLGITRQESGFDPTVRSGADARGMMQLLPSTASVVARRMGMGFSASRLYEADYNMQIGSTYLGQLVDRFSGSYVMAAAGYNAGPGRPSQWTSFCGDPRGGASDPLDFIECIPFSETRNYVMRVLENMQVYRAKMAGGTAPITLSSDLRRGAYNYAATGQVVSVSTP
jgi:soluble lytic murein transglycosylase